MSAFEKRDVHLSSPPQKGNNRISLIGSNVGPLALASFGTLLSAKI